MAQIEKIPSPALPYATPEYSTTYTDQFLKILRLYFSRVTETLNLLIGKNGGQYVDCPNGLFFSTDDQPIAVVNVAQPIDFPIEYLNNAVRVNAGTDSRIYVDISGVYNFQFSGQLRSGSASSKQVYIWIRRNNTDIGYSTHQYTVAGSGNHLNVSWNFNIDLAAGEYIEMRWSSDSTDMKLESTTATAPHPGMPSAVMAVNFVAPLPVPRPIAP